MNGSPVSYDFVNGDLIFLIFKIFNFETVKFRKYLWQKPISRPSMSITANFP